ncbi:cell division protein PerM [Herbiconiux solani]|uniref:cell division protein PerM n=1 Tax=Herbiconiux solani TaxID=661329 RepID=UPI000825809B|nr:DUF6350 family protein [Herbiconiux solani]
MNRPLTALLAALDALIVVAIGIGIPLIPLTLLWATQFGLAVDWLVFWRASGDLWLLGNGVDVLFAIDPTLALRFGLDGAATPFTVGLAPLGFAFVTALLGTRAGRRLGSTAYPVTGALVGMLAVGLLGLLVQLGVRIDGAEPSLVQSIVFPAVVYGIGIAIGYAWAGKRTAPVEFGAASGFRRRLTARWTTVPAGDRGLVALAFRAGVASASAIIGVSAVALAIVLVAGFSSIVSLYEGLQAGLMGGISLTLGQLALLPNLVAWTMSWFVGPGFAIGAGSTVSPLATQVGLVPSLPVLGALPQGAPALGFAGLVVPVAIGFVIAALLRPAYLEAVRGRGKRVLRLVLTAVGAAVVGASVLAVLALWSGGAAGPGRLADVGPDAGAVWLWSFVELVVSILLGLVAGATSSAEPVAKASKATAPSRPSTTDAETAAIHPAPRTPAPGPADTL